MKTISAIAVVLTFLSTSASLAQYRDTPNEDRGDRGQQQTEPQNRNNDEGARDGRNQRHQNDSHGTPQGQRNDDRPGSNEVRDNPHFSRGDKLSSEYRDNNHVVSDWKSNHLRQPPRGYHWVRANNQYVLAAVATGLIADIIMSN